MRCMFGSSLGHSLCELGRPRNTLMSVLTWWVGPSAPTMRGDSSTKVTRQLFDAHIGESVWSKPVAGRCL